MAKVKITKRKTFASLIQAMEHTPHLPSKIYASRNWYREKAMKVQKYREGDTQRILKIGRLNRRMRSGIRGKMMLGRLWMFEYDPISAEDTLAKGGYYDAFPCVFPIQPLEEGFLGINMHFLPYDWRAHLMDNLYDLIDDLDAIDATSADTSWSSSQRLRIPSVDGYDFLKRSAKYRYFRPALRKYLYNRTLSRFMSIPANEWEIALFLPLERFHGQSRRKIWMDTKMKYRKGIQSGFNPPKGRKVRHGWTQR